MIPEHQNYLKITVATPVYNRQDCIVRCIESVVNQSFVPFELLIVDDGSQDDTVAIIQPYIEKNPWITLYKMAQNKGVNAARNCCVSQARGEYILWLDSDDELVPEAIEQIVNEVKQVDLVDYKHFMFVVSDRQEEFSRNGLYNRDRNIISYNQWLLGDVTGDFAHLMHIDILRKFSFFEEFKASEGLNFLRIHRFTQKQLFINKLIISRTRGRHDSLSLDGFLTNESNIIEKYRYNYFFIENFGLDLLSLNKVTYYKTSLQLLVIGVSLGFQSQNIALFTKLKSLSLVTLSKVLGGRVLKKIFYYSIITFSKIKNRRVIT